MFTALLSAASLTSAAITPDDICWRDGRGIAYQTATGDFSYASLPIKQTGAVEIEKIDANTIRVHNFLNMFKYVDFTLDGTTVKLKNHGDNSFVAETPDGKEMLLCAGSVNGPYSLNISPVQYPWYENFADQDVEYTGEIIVKNAESHLFNLYFPKPLFVYDGNFETSQLFTSVQIDTFIPNASVTDKVTAYNGDVKTRSYEIGFVKAADGSFEAPNFSNNGVCTLDASPAMLTVYSRPYTAWYRPGDGNSYWVYSPADVTVYQQKFGKYVSNANYKGAKVYEERASEIPAAPGSYVVKAGKTTAKLIVR
ncbi:MAG: hypothetical protein J6J61_04670 [Muribaculaceae bacterium]|nr:hypothetical protein [Muribaculaceae bacterium]